MEVKIWLLLSLGLFWASVVGASPVKKSEASSSLLAAVKLFRESLKRFKPVESLEIPITQG